MIKTIERKLGKTIERRTLEGFQKAFPKVGDVRGLGVDPVDLRGTAGAALADAVEHDQHLG